MDKERAQIAHAAVDRSPTTFVVARPGAVGTQELLARTFCLTTRGRALLIPANPTMIGQAPPRYVEGGCAIPSSHVRHRRAEASRTSCDNGCLDFQPTPE